MGTRSWVLEGRLYSPGRSPRCELCATRSGAVHYEVRQTPAVSFSLVRVLRLLYFAAVRHVLAGGSRGTALLYYQTDRPARSWCPIWPRVRSMAVLTVSSSQLTWGLDLIVALGGHNVLMSKPPDTTESETVSGIANPDPSSQTLGGFLRREWINLLVVAPTLTALLAALQVFVFAEGDAATFRFLVQTLNIQALLSVTLMPIVTMMIILLTFASFAYRVGRPSRGAINRVLDALGTARTAFLLIGAATTFTLLLYSSPFVCVTTIVLGIILGRFARRAKGRGQEFSLKSASSTIPFFLLLVIMAMLNGDSWIPAETARLGANTSISVIYVLEMKEDQATLLDKTAGHARVIPVEDLHDRQTCDDHDSGWITQPLAHYLWSNDKRKTNIMSHPPCPKRPPPSASAIPSTFVHTPWSGHGLPGQGGAPHV
jgi:hypothetical protein